MNARQRQRVLPKALACLAAFAAACGAGPPAEQRLTTASPTAARDTAPTPTPPESVAAGPQGTPAAPAVKVAEAPLAAMGPRELERLIISAGGLSVNVGGGGGFAPQTPGRSDDAAHRIAAGDRLTLKPHYCDSLLINGVAFLFVAGRDGSHAWTSDADQIALMGPACRRGAPMVLTLLSVDGVNFVWNSALLGAVR